jgi:hypothetical protein
VGHAKRDKEVLNPLQNLLYNNKIKIIKITRDGFNSKIPVA